MSIARVSTVVGVLALALAASETKAAPLGRIQSPAAVTRSSGSIDARALLHNPQLLAYRNPFGAVAAGTVVTLRLRTAHGGATSVALYYQQSSTRARGHTALKIVARGKRYDTWGVSFTPRDVAVYTYDFLVQHGSTKRWYSDTAGENSAGTEYTHTPAQQFHLTSYAPGFKTPTWAPDAVYYQIFPDSFFNGDPTNDRRVMAPLGGEPSPTFYASERDAPKGRTASTEATCRASTTN